MTNSFFSGIIKSSKSKNGRSVLLIRISITLIILTALFWWLPVDKLIGAIANIPINIWLLVITGFLMGHVLSAIKWRMLLHAVSIKISRREAIVAHGAGLFANLCLPSIVGGDLVRAGVIIRRHGKLEAIALGSMADRVNDTLALVLIAALSGLLIPGFAESQAAMLLVWVSLLLLLLVSCGIAFVYFLPTHLLPTKICGFTNKFKEALKSLFSSPGIAITAFLLSIAIQGGFVLLNSRLALAMDISIPMAVWFLVWPLAKLIALLPVSMGGIGVREAALAVLLAPFGVNSSLSVAQSLSWEAVLIFSGLFTGVVITMLPGNLYNKNRNKGDHS